MPFKNKALFGNLLPGSLVSLSDLVDPGNEAFEKPLLRVSIKEGIVEDHLHEIGLGDQFRNSKSGVKSMRFEDLPPAKGLAELPEKKRVEKTSKGRRSKEELIAEIEDLMANGKKQNDIARILGIPYSQAAYYVRKLANDKAGTEAESKSEPVPETTPEVKAEPIPEAKPEPVDADLKQEPRILTAQPFIIHATQPLPESRIITSPERPSKPKIVSINELQKIWTETYQNDQAQAALAARILKFLDGLSEDFQDDSQLADEVANYGIIALIRRYRQMSEKQIMP